MPLKTHKSQVYNFMNFHKIATPMWSTLRCRKNRVRALASSQGLPPQPSPVPRLPPHPVQGHLPLTPVHSSHLSVTNLHATGGLGQRSTWSTQGSDQELQDRSWFSYSSGDQWEIRGPLWVESSEGQSSGMQEAICLLCPGAKQRWRHTETRRQKQAQIKGTNPTMRAPPSWPHLSMILSTGPIPKYRED